MAFFMGRHTRNTPSLTFCGEGRQGFVLLRAPGTWDFDHVGGASSN